MSGSEVVEAMDSALEVGEVEAAERVERDEHEPERRERERPSWSSFLLRGCPYGSSSSSSESDAGSSSSFGHR